MNWAMAFFSCTSPCHYNKEVAKIMKRSHITTVDYQETAKLTTTTTGALSMLPNLL
jgi:hypothetical protein